MTAKTIETPTGKPAQIAGVTSLGGSKYYKITYDGHSAFVQPKNFVDNTARPTLSDRGVLITSAADWRKITEGIESIRDFPKRPLVDEPGWLGGYFADASGKVYTPEGSPKGTALFQPNRQSGGTKGSLKAWQQQVASPLTGQNLLMIAVFIAFAAPLLRLTGETHNPGFEFSGPPETGKTTTLRLMASIAGPPHAIPNFNSTIAGLESMFPEHRDLPFPVDEANLADRKRLLIDFAFRMANGTAKVTAYQEDRAQVRFIFATTANRPFFEALKAIDTDTANAALQRLMPLRIADGAFGVFDFVPDGFTTSGEFAAYLEETINRQYGTPMRSFLRELVNAHAQDPKGFQAKLRKLIGRFAKKVGVAATSRGKTRATTTFGLLYAAGVLAKRWDILPKKWQCMSACVAGYRNYQAQLPAQTPLLTRLATIAARSQTMDLREGDRPSLTDEQIEEAGAFLITGVGGRVELLITHDLRSEYFPDWLKLQNTTEFQALNLRDREHATKQRQVRTERKKERFFCFKLPPSILAQIKSL